MREHPSFRVALFHRLVTTIGLASTVATAACGDSQGSGTGAAGGAGGEGSTSSGSGTTSSTSTTSTTTTTSSTSTSSSTSSTSSTSSSTSSGMMNIERCFPSGGAPCPDVAAAAATFGTCTSTNERVLAWLSGPTASGTDCCYQVDVTDPDDVQCVGVPGRPFVVDGRARKAPIERGARGWDAKAIARLPVMEGLDGATRAQIGRQWAEDAAYEHASVASFGKLALELLAFGAPADLIRATHEAALDEIGHAAMAFALAGRYLGAPVGPGALREARSFAGAATLAELVDAAVREGCFGETAAAIVASLQHDEAADPAAREALAIIAEEEARHAELAFRVVAWAIAAGGEDARAAARHALAAALDEAERAADRARSEAPATDVVRAHGRLSNGEVLAARLAAGRDVVAPAMERLLGAAS